MDATRDEREHAFLQHMKRTWNARALENARYYIASSENSASEAAFRASGARDLGLLFGGLEHLLHGGASVVDLGCGIGRVAEFVAPRVKWLTGVDISEEMLALARVRLAHLENLDFRANDGVSLAGIADASVDVVLCHVVFQHVPLDVVRFYLAETHRVLVPGGHLVFQVPEFIGAPPAPPPLEDSWTVRFYAEDDLRAAAELHGLIWHEPARLYMLDATPPFNQLRVHVSKPAALTAR